MGPQTHLLKSSQTNQPFNSGDMRGTSEFLGVPTLDGSLNTQPWGGHWPQGLQLGSASPLLLSQQRAETRAAGHRARNWARAPREEGVTEVSGNFLQAVVRVPRAASELPRYL